MEGSGGRTEGGTEVEWIWELVWGDEIEKREGEWEVGGGGKLTLPLTSLPPSLKKDF